MVKHRRGKELPSDPDECALIATRFWSKVARGQGCWEYQGKPVPYPEMTHNQVIYRTHVLGYLLQHGPIPPGLYVLHTCDNKSCVRDIHLYAGTHLQNIQDAVERGRARKGRLTDDEVRAIRLDPRSQPTIARDYNISQPLVSEIKGNKAYGRVDR